MKPQIFALLIAYAAAFLVFGAVLNKSWNKHPPCSEVQRLIIDGRVFTGSWWIETEPGTNVKQIRVPFPGREQ